MKRRILLFCMLLLILLSLSSCGIPQPPAEDEIADDIPEDILSYSLDGAQNFMTVKEVTIDRRQTNEKQDYVYAVIDMEDDYLHRTAYYILTYNYYDTGGWILDNYEQYQDTVAYPVSPPSEDWIYFKIGEYYNYEHVSLDDSTLKSGYCTFKFDINDKRPNVIYSGEVELLCQLNCNPGSEMYSWQYCVEENDLSATWDIIGTWATEIEASALWGYDYYHLTLNITDITDSTITANGSFGYTGSIYEDMRNMQFDTVFEYSIVEDNGIPSLSFAIKTTPGNSSVYWRVYFTSDNASAQHEAYPRAELIRY